jgi:hypothetical protein
MSGRRSKRDDRSIAKKGVVSRAWLFGIDMMSISSIDLNLKSLVARRRDTQGQFGHAQTIGESG